MRGERQTRGRAEAVCRKYYGRLRGWQRPEAEGDGRREAAEALRNWRAEVEAEGELQATDLKIGVGRHER